MAYFQVHFSERNRKCVAKTLAVFCLFQAILGILLFLFAVYFQIHLHWKVKLIEDYNSESLYKLILSVGIITFILHVIGGKMCYDCGSIDTRPRFEKIFFLWLILILVTGITQFATSMVCFHHTAKTRDQFKIGFICTMKKYLSSVEIKAGLDFLQMDHRCCGAENFKDWMITDWVIPDYNPLLRNKSLMKEYKTYYDYRPPKVKLIDNQLIVTPFSCCDMNQMGPCFHDFVTQPGLASTASELTKKQWWEGNGLMQQGCVSLIMEAYSEYLAYAAYSFLSAFGTQFVIILLARYLQTSMDNIAMYGKEDGSAPAWLCDC